MTHTYDGLFVRNTLGSTNTLPKTSSSSCPDLITLGSAPLANPQKTLAGSYNEAPNYTLDFSEANYLYVRAKNYGEVPMTGKAQLFYAPSNLILYPDVWKNNRIPSSAPGPSGETVYSIPLGSDPGQIAVTRDAFLWESPPRLATAQHYSIITRVLSEQHNEPLPTHIKTQQELLEWVANSGGFGWSTERTVDPNVDFTNSTNYNQGAEGGGVMFALRCIGVPPGAAVSLSSGAALPDGQRIYIPFTTIPEGISPTEPYVISTQVRIPANWRSMFVWFYKSNDKPAPPNFNITLQALMPSPQGSEAVMKMARSLEELGHQHGHTINARSGQFGALRCSSGPSHAILLGQDTIRQG